MSYLTSKLLHIGITGYLILLLASIGALASEWSAYHYTGGEVRELVVADIIEESNITTFLGDNMSYIYRDIDLNFGDIISFNIWAPHNTGYLYVYVNNEVEKNASQLHESWAKYILEYNPQNTYSLLLDSNWAKVSGFERNESIHNMKIFVLGSENGSYVGSTNKIILSDFNIEHNNIVPEPNSIGLCLIGLPFARFILTKLV